MRLPNYYTSLPLSHHAWRPATTHVACHFTLVFLLPHDSNPALARHHLHHDLHLSINSLCQSPANLNITLPAIQKPLSTPIIYIVTSGIDAETIDRSGETLFFFVPFPWRQAGWSRLYICFLLMSSKPLHRHCTTIQPQHGSPKYDTRETQSFFRNILGLFLPFRF